MADEPRIRRATADDLERIREIAVAGWTPIFERYLHVVGEALWRDVWGGWHKGWYRRDPEKWDGRAIVVEAEGGIAGFATWSSRSETAGEVGGNAVDPAYQGRGYGTAQIREVLSILRQEGRAFARVHTGLDPSHGPARRQYQRVGLTIPVKNSVYLNSLNAVADLPCPSSTEVRAASSNDAAAIDELVSAIWTEVDARVRASGRRYVRGMLSSSDGEANRRHARAAARLAGTRAACVRRMRALGTGRGGRRATQAAWVDHAARRSPIAAQPGRRQLPVHGRVRVVSKGGDAPRPRDGGVGRGNGRIARAMLQGRHVARTALGGLLRQVVTGPYAMSVDARKDGGVLFLMTIDCDHGRMRGGM